MTPEDYASVAASRSGVGRRAKRGTQARESRTRRVLTLLPVAVGIGAALATGLSGCALGGSDLGKSTNLANQRKAAIAFLESQGGVEKIRFVQEGGQPGLGASWRADAVVTVEGNDYRATLSPQLISSEPLPDIDPGAMRASVTVIFSDDSSEVIE